ncbi:DUF1513 domain-containing protein [Photobacterium atrarenae]|uniref:DUF1513 domain-containing protein n=1 Tax=Photobacterium atrarenae TaxID=865757 RepID=A0ABY5GIW5_9GAMM|nr:DUF1513 domain-containing protein [Photobacterium atrarenae]UTV29240.1 DUF1513 domain-containing protein [Photobacterium atrarenae]
MVTDTTRRKLLRAALGAAALAPMTSALTACSSTTSATRATPRIIGCSRTAKGGYAVVVAAQDGQPIYRVALPGRGHGVALQPGGTLAAAFSRRPGQYLQVMDYQSGEAWPIRVADPGRHFYGHGVFSADGQYLYVTEGISTTSEGVIGVYQVVPGLPKVAEYTGFGIGPHEAVLVDAQTLAIGVGGVHTQGRTPLNLETMQPALVYLDARTGALLEQVTLADKRLSIRHLSVTDTGEVACGQQYRGEPEQAAPLVALHRRGEPLRQLLANDEQWLRFNHYIASIASVDGYLLATSPRGNCYGIWHEASRELVDIRPLVDASGVGIFQGEWLVGSGSGKVLTVAPPAQVTGSQSPVMWDNHWNVLPV